MPPSFTNSLAQSTSPAFSILEGFITSISSLAQLLESTYMATHSSFFALAGVADQMGSAKLYLGQILGAFSVLRWGRGLLAWLRGGGSSSSPGFAGNWGEEFASLGQGLHQGLPGAGGRPPQQKRPSAKPLVFFLLTAIGLPFAMSRLITLLSRSLPPPPSLNPLENPPLPGNLTFARAIHRFEPKDAVELGLVEGEIVAVLERLPSADGSEGLWWRGRTREGKVGWFPKSFVEE